MVARLTVVMIHTSPTHSRGARMAETLVGELIGRPGIDLVLVGPIADMDSNATDRLTLESIATDLAVLAWKPVSVTMEELAAIGFAGQRSPHVGDVDAEPCPPDLRKIFAFDLNGFSEAVPVIESLQSLRRSQDVRTFSINGLGLAKPVQRASGPTIREPRPPQPSPSKGLDLDDLLDQLDRSDS